MLMYNIPLNLTSYILYGLMLSICSSSTNPAIPPH